MTRLRCLKLEDAPKMIEWMHDSDINSWFEFDAQKCTINDAKKFIENSNDKLKCEKNLHLAVSDETDEYLGTVSLKNITEDKAELAIVLRKCAIGKNIGYESVKLMVDIAFEQLSLEEVYLNVLENNYRAIRLYEKIGFVFFNKTKTIIKGEKIGLKWYILHRKNDMQ